MEVSRKFPIKKIFMDGNTREAEDTVIAEYEVEAYVKETYLFSLYCTPCDLDELVMGHLLTEGWIQKRDDVVQLKWDRERKRVAVFFREIPKKPVAEILPLCRIPWSASYLLKHGAEFFQGSDLFQKTGGVHTCVIVQDENVICRYEDIGRHNAIDKAVGFAINQGIDLRHVILFTSGRIPSDMAKKIIRSKIPVAVSHSAVTDASIELAKTYGLTLIGFVRDNRMNLYTE